MSQSAGSQGHHINKEQVTTTTRVLDLRKQKRNWLEIAKQNLFSWSTNGGNGEDANLGVDMAVGTLASMRWR
jgi:hypothetical protein